MTDDTHTDDFVTVPLQTERGELIAVEVPQHVLEAQGRGESVTWRAPEDPFELAYANAVDDLRFRQAEIERRLQEMMDEYPQLRLPEYRALLDELRREQESESDE